MGIVLMWLFFSFAFAFLGNQRKIGFSRALILCLLLSPIIGLIFILTSEKFSETTLKLKIQLDSNLISQEKYDMEMRKMYPNKEDKRNMWLGYGFVALILAIIWVLWIIFK